MLEQIFRVIFEFAHDSDLSTEAARRAFQKAARSVAKSPYQLSEAVRYQTLHHIAEILDAWHREPAFLNEHGDPRSLPFSGPKSFSTVARRFLPRFNPRDIADILVGERLLEREQPMPVEGDLLKGILSAFYEERLLGATSLDGIHSVGNQSAGSLASLPRFG